ncbi:hypothetical protein LOAG_08889 [Loa loa]|uniref:Uncharacterized protein n=1 Tax=Loa loa TaxID=7209 RepID=A0A1S0TSN2_LOALO|nr:hypothetical protein LOAG_08889 [Loa loa]EFO19601.1 hypothetical protein LOAG_08889 [Loa loa]
MSEKYTGTTRLEVIAVSYDAFDAIEPLKQLVEDHGAFKPDLQGQPFHPVKKVYKDGSFEFC